MKMLKTQTFRILAVLGVALFAAACSDGELASTAAPSIAPAPPIIITFAANPAQVKVGGETTISWEVANADTVEITAVSSDGKPVNFHVQTEELTGSSPVQGLTANTDFTLTATKKTTTVEGGEETTKAVSIMSGQIQFGPEGGDASGNAAIPSTTTASQTISVTVGSRIVASIEADKSKISAGEQTIIRWEVTPSDGVTTVVSADSNEPIAATDKCEGSIQDILSQPAMNPMPAKGCAVVAPSAKTVYTVVGTNSANDKGEASTTVEVAASDVTAEIYLGKDANEKSKHLSLDSFEQPVYVSWKAGPKGAKVTVTADTATSKDDTKGAKCELPTAAENKEEGSTICIVSNKTTFKIKAELGTATDEDTADVTIGASAAAPGLMMSEDWAFENEKVPVEAKLDDATKANASIIEKVMVNGTEISSEDLKALKEGTAVNLMVTAKDVLDQVKIVYSGGKEAKFEPVKVVALSKDDLGVSEKSVSSAKFVVNGDQFNRYRGVQMNGFNKGIARMYVNEGMKSFAFGDAIKATAPEGATFQESFFENLSDYPVAVEADGSTVIVGTSGAAMLSKDGGNKWETIFVSRTLAAENLGLGNHATCGRASGGGQNVLKGATSMGFIGDIINLNQVCDILKIGDRVLLATDFGVMVDENITDSELKWVGKLKAGVDGASVGALTFGHVVNDLIKVEDRVFAATDAGVVVSNDPARVGIGWAQAGTVNGPVYALAYNPTSKKIYAATETGVYEASAEGTSQTWTQLGSVGAATAIAVDAGTTGESTKIFAATSSGLQVSRDDGKTWTSVPMFASGSAIHAISMANVPSGDRMKYAIMIAADSGAMWSDTIKVLKKTAANTSSDTSDEDNAGDDTTTDDNSDVTKKSPGTKTELQSSYSLSLISKIGK